MGDKGHGGGGDREVGRKGSKANPTYVAFSPSVRSPVSAFVNGKLLFGKCGIINVR